MTRPFSTTSWRGTCTTSTPRRTARSTPTSARPTRSGVSFLGNGQPFIDGEYAGGFFMLGGSGSLLDSFNDDLIPALERGSVSVNGRHEFTDRLAGFVEAKFAQTKKFPDVRLEVTTEDRPVDMIEEGYDLVIRVNPHPDETLVGRAFLRDRLVVVASPDLARPAEGSAAPAVVRGTVSGPEDWEVKNTTGRSTIRIDPVLSLSSMIMVRDAVRAGVGAGRLPVSLVNHDLAAGCLAHWGDVNGPEIALWSLYPSRRLLSPRVSAFLDHLKSAFPTGEPHELAAFVGV